MASIGRNLSLWYRRYSVGECWLADPASRTVTVVACDSEHAQLRRFSGAERVDSCVLPPFAHTAREFFAA